MEVRVKLVKMVFSVVFLCLFCFAATGLAQEKGGSIMVMKIEKKGAALTGTKGKGETSLSGEVVYRIIQTRKAMAFELDSLGLVGTGINTERGESGNISIKLKPKTSRTKYDPKRRVIESTFLVEVHYPLIDRIKGYIVPKEGEREMDDYRSYTETFEGTIVSQLSESPRLGKKMEMKKGAAVTIKMNPTEKVLGEISQLYGEFRVIDVIIFPRRYIKRYINVQPVFVRYTPGQGCFGGTTTATTGGSFNTLRDRSIEMWNRCCIGLNFLPPVYVENDDYRILSSAEEANLRAEYNDANAVEVFFVEVSDPVGLHGGGVCFSSGTANAQIITYDTNLPINLYNLAHELGHALGLFHPPGNSTPASLMEPSGFCADNPALMSNENCDNASNPLLTTRIPLTLCIRNTNM